MNQETKAFLTFQLLATRELSRLTGIPEVTLKQRAYRGQIDFVKKGGILLFDRRDFEEAIREHQRRQEHQLCQEGRQNPSAPDVPAA